MPDPNLTEQADLRGGEPPWAAAVTRVPRKPLAQSLRCGVLVVGGGITGSLAAEHLSAQGLDVCVIDREKPGFGSTAASTAMLQWEIDKSLSDLTEVYGFERAANIYRRSFDAVQGLKDLAQSHGMDGIVRPRQSAYLAASEIGARELLAEHELRKRANLPGDYLEHAALMQEFGFNREAAIVSPGSADANPLKLSQSLLARAVQQGASLYDAEAVSYGSGGSRAFAELSDGNVIEADHIVLATGYVMPDFLPAHVHKIVSSWAIATPPQDDGALWRDQALVWEASTDYHYARVTADKRIIIGGEDDSELTEPDARNAATPAKTEALLKQLHALWPRAIAAENYAWSGAFGTTNDGLPLIGEVPGQPRLYAAYGYGGNGITFSYLASRMIGRLIAGDKQDWFSDFAIDRDVPEMD